MNDDDLLEPVSDAVFGLVLAGLSGAIMGSLVTFLLCAVMR